MTPDEILDILDACDHEPAGLFGACYECALKAIAAAVEAERARVEAVIRREVDAPWRDALLEDIRDNARGAK